MAKSTAVATRQTPFAMVTLAKVHEKPSRERTDYGWESLKKPKQSLRVPYSMVKNARVSLFQHQRRMQDAWEERKAAAELASAPFTEKKPSFQTYPACDAEGRYLCAKKDGTLYEFVERTDPLAIPNALNERGKEIPAFYEFVRAS